jgi:hypothetical protein
MRNKATAERAAPRLGFIVSVLLHLGVVAVMFVSFSRKLDIPEQMTPIVPVDLVTLSDQTNIAPQAPPQQEAPPETPMQQPAAQPEVQPPDVVIAPEAKKTPDKPKKKEEAKFNIDDIFANLKKLPPKNAKPGARVIQGAGAETGLSADLNSYLASQIYRCWSPPTGVVGAATLIVVYDVYMNKDGTVADKPKLLSSGSPPGTPRDAANQAAMRAIYQCEPYKLPANRYNEWRHFSFSFDPRIMAGQ